jgi:hypothetical protein
VDAAMANGNRPPPDQDVENNGIELPSNPPASSPKPPPTYGHMRACYTSASGIEVMPDEWQVVPNTAPLTPSAVLLPSSPFYVPSPVLLP